MKSLVMYLSIAVVLTAGVASAGTYSGGDGSAGNPYQIADKADLLMLAAMPADYDKCFILTSDIDLAEDLFASAVIAPDTSDDAGYQGVGFTGCFDGNFHIISNLTIHTQGQQKSYLGLFGWIQSGFSGEGIVKRLGLENVSITAGDHSEMIGALAGMAEQPIAECYATGNIQCGADSHIIGGLIGGSGSQVMNCYTDVDIHASGNTADVGGFAGKAYGIFVSCYASGYVEGNSPAAGGFGGSTLFGNWFIYNCYFLAPGDGGGPNNGIGTALSDAALRQRASFINWDFQGDAGDGEEEVWLMAGGYPVLSWQVPVGMRQLAVLSQYWQMDGCISGHPCVIADWYDDDVIDMKDMVLLAASWLDRGMATDYPKIADDFETGDFTKLPWVQGGAADWTIISGEDVYQGNYSARSGVISDSQSSTLTLTATCVQDSEIVFAAKVSSESGYDKLVFYIDGSVREMGISGEVEWYESRFNFSAGTHTFTWAYEKDGRSSKRSDCAWIDQIRIVRLAE